jgi:hypothetical protein
MDALSNSVEFVLWTSTWVAVLLGLLFRIGEAMWHWYIRLRHRHETFPGHPLARPILLLIVGVVLAVTIALPSSAAAGQGFWWGSPVNPGFDRNTVIQATGTATQVDIVTRGGPCTLSLQTSTERFTVMLGPGWFLSERNADIQKGDALVVEGSKMMDRQGYLHLVAARVTNQRTGAVLTLRDDTGRPVWMSGRPSRQ